MHLNNKKQYLAFKCRFCVVNVVNVVDVSIKILANLFFLLFGYYTFKQKTHLTYTNSVYYSLPCIMIENKLVILLKNILANKYH